MKFVVIVIALLGLSSAITGTKASSIHNNGQWVESVCYTYIDLSGN